MWHSLKETFCDLLTCTKGSQLRRPVLLIISLKFPKQSTSECVLCMNTFQTFISSWVLPLQFSCILLVHRQSYHPPEITRVSIRHPYAPWFPMGSQHQHLFLCPNVSASFWDHALLGLQANSECGFHFQNHDCCLISINRIAQEWREGWKRERTGDHKTHCLFVFIWGLELTVQTRLTSDPQRSACFCL